MIQFLHRYHLTHPLVAAAMFLALSPLGLITAALVPVAFYYSREFAHTEIGAGEGWFQPWRHALPWQWRAKEQLDFWPVVAVVIVLTVIWSRFP